MNLDKAKEMYLYDPIFHTLVDTIYKGIMEMQYTPGEVRAAAMLAAIKSEESQIRDGFKTKA